MEFPEVNALGIAAICAAIALLCRRAPWIAFIMVAATAGVGIAGALGHWSPSERPDLIARWVGWLLGACGASLVAAIGQQEREDRADELARESVSARRASWPSAETSGNDFGSPKPRRDAC